jgi:hypothetical protein
MSEEIEVVDGVPVRSEEIGFDPSQLVACSGCGRSNAPNRSECIYCGAELPIDPAAAPALKLRNVEAWEKAFNIVLIGKGIPQTHLVPSPLDADVIQQAIEVDPPTPIGRVATAEAAAAVNERVKDAKLHSIVVSDEDLSILRPSVRLRSLSAADGGFVLTTFNTNERVEFPVGSLRLIVIGRLFEERLEQTLKKKRGGVKEVEGRNVSKDSGVIDIYFDHEPNGFRILEGGFDFSGLGERRSFLAAENMNTLIEELRMFAPSAVVSEDYIAKRHILEKFWPCSIRNDSRGVQRAKFGLIVEKAEVTTNVEQFTKYSRLVRLTI